MSNVYSNGEVIEQFLNNYPQLKTAIKGKFLSIDAIYGYNGVPATLIRSFFR